MQSQTRFHIGYWLAALVGLMLIQYGYTRAQRIEPSPI